LKVRKSSALTAHSGKYYETSVVELVFCSWRQPFQNTAERLCQRSVQCWYCSFCAYTELIVSTTADIWQNFFLGRNELEILISMDYLKEQLFKQQKI